MSDPADSAHPSRRALTPWGIRARLEESLVSDIRDVVMFKDLKPERYRPKTDLTVREGDREAVLRFCRAHEELQRHQTKCASYLDNGYRALLAEVDGAVVGYIWWHDHRVARCCAHPHLVRYGLELEPGQVWGFDLVLLEQARGKGASNDFFARFRAHLLGLGYTRVYGHVDASNTPAVWLHKLQGYKKVKAVEGRLYGKLFLHSGGRLFLRNPPVLARQKFDFRALW
jgi:GNAT superfamily N-acetyltransferase